MYATPSPVSDTGQTFRSSVSLAWPGSPRDGLGWQGPECRRAAPWSGALFSEQQQGFICTGLDQF